jgi:hypothetical protein
VATAHMAAHVPRDIGDNIFHDQCISVTNVFKYQRHRHFMTNAVAPPSCVHSDGSCQESKREAGEASCRAGN